MEHVLGIDLGTTFTVIAHFNQETGRPEIITDPESQDRLTPSIVLFEDSSSVLVGRLARQNAVLEAERVVEYVKRQMGKPVGKADGGWSFSINGTVYNAQMISALILKKVKQDAETRLGGPVSKAVITVPAYFGEAQRAATEEAGRLAGFGVLSILDEPVSAALAYTMDHLDENQRIFVFDLGGGTLDVTIIEIRDGTVREIAINGDHQLGGKNFDEAIINWASAEFHRRYGSNPQEDPSSYQDLKLRVIQAKEELSRRSMVRLLVSHRGNVLPLELTREQFEAMNRHLVDRCRTLCEIVMDEAAMGWSEIDRVLLVGGSTRIPGVREMLRNLTNKEPSADLNPDECVAIGAAWQAKMIQTSERGVTWSGLKRAEALGTVSVEPITAHHLGLSTFYPAFDSLRSMLMIPKSTPLPHVQTRTVYTRFENQTSAMLPVLQGGEYFDNDSCTPDMCEQIGEVTLDGLPEAPAGLPIEVTYQCNASNILTVWGRHIESGREVTAEFHPRGGMSSTGFAEARAAIESISINRID